MPAKKPGEVRPARTKVSSAREAAFQILRELAGSSQLHSDDLLRNSKVEALPAQDRNLCTALVMGVLRWQLQLDAVVANLTTHKSRMDEPVRVALRLGAFQLLLMDRIPAHAAISDSVELTKRAGHRFASGLVNAILRKIAAQAATITEKMNAEAAHPAWLLARWQNAAGAAAAAAICSYGQQPPRASVRLAGTDAESELQNDGILVEPGDFLVCARRIVSGSVADSRALLSGVVRLQDEGSQLIAELPGSRLHKVRSILDCCAAPGGKTAMLAERHPSAHVVACDVSAPRAAAMRQRFQVSPLLSRIECRTADAASMPVAGLYDLILCDVPCSGTGTLARNPEIKLRLKPEDLPRQQQRQVAILTAALRHLAVGGRLVYSTCSLEREENEDVIEQIIAKETDVRLLPVEHRIRELLAEGILHSEGAAHLLTHAVSGDFLRTIPGLSPCDGFFAAILTRT